MARSRPANLPLLSTMLVLLVIAIPCAYLGIGRMFSHWDWLNDMHYFYDGAKVVVDGNRAMLYDLQARHDAGYGFDPNDQVFPYPATLAYLLAPLALTDIVSARYLFTAFAAVCLGGIALAAWVWSRDWRLAALTLLGCASSFTVYEALRFQQLSPVLALLLAVALLTSVSPRSLVGGVFCGFLALKPTIAAAPLSFITLRRAVPQILAAVFTAATVFLIIPLATVGIDGLREYFDMLSRYRDESFTLHGGLTAGAGWMLGWQALVGRLTQADPSPWVIAPLAALTLAVMLRVWSRGQYFESWLAGTLTALLVVPHVLWYDWVVLLAVAPFAAYANRSAVLVALLLALHAAVSLDSYLIVTQPVSLAYPVPTPLIAAAILLYLALAPAQRRPRTAGLSSPASL